MDVLAFPYRIHFMDFKMIDDQYFHLTPAVLEVCRSDCGESVSLICPAFVVLL